MAFKAVLAKNQKTKMRNSAIGVCVTIVMSVSGVLVYGLNSTVVYESEIQTNNTKILSSYYNSVYDNVSSVTNTVAADLIHSGYNVNNLNSDQIKNVGTICQTILKVNPILAGLVLSDSQGHAVVFSKNNSSHPVDIGSRAYFQVLKQQPDTKMFVSKPIMSKLRKVDVLVFAIPLKDAQEKFRGVLGVGIEPAYFNNVFSSIKTKKNTFIGLFDQDGDAQAELLNSCARCNVHGMRNSKVFDIIKQHASGTFFHKSAVDQSYRLISYQKLDSWNSYIVFSVPISDIVMPWLQSNLIFIFIAVFAIAFVMWFVHMINRNSQELQDQNRIIANLAHYDSLTQLPNRLMFKETLEQAVANAAEHNTELSLIYMDLDKFKEVNDTMGHNHGDLLLVEVSKRIQDCLRPQDFVARIGGR